MSDDASLRIDELVASLEARRAVLGDSAVDFAIASIRSSQRAASQAAPPQPAPPRSVPPAEPRLRQVTILFCDVVDSTAMLQGLSPEDAMQAIDPLLASFAAGVRKSGGKVLKFTGDGLMAAFGAQASREDDAERAVLAGLALLDLAREHAARVQREFGIENLAIRVGVNTGPVMLGAGIEADNAAMGHAVHIAARMEQHAPVGALRISHGTWLHVRGLFEMEAQPPLAVKGSSEPLLTYLVRRPIAPEFRVANRGLEGVVTPMVGRDAELASLMSAVDEARSARTLRALTVIGEAGVGKSRLLHEFRLAVVARYPARDTLRFRARTSSVLQPYGALRGLIATRLGITDDATAEAARRTLVDGLAPLFAERGELQVQLIGRLIGIDFPDSPLIQNIEGRELRARAFRALRTLLGLLAAAAFAKGGVLLLVLDDLHWADDGSLDFIESLFDEEFAQPLVVLMLARGELLERRNEWLHAAKAHTRLALTALDRARSGALADALLQHARDVPEALRALLVERTEGNPFYMEELVRMLIDDGVIEPYAYGWRVHADKLALTRVPTTLIGVLQARLESLPPADRHALQLASIIGHVFWDAALGVLDEAAPASLANLSARALVHRREATAFEGTTELGFHHQMLHEVTYGTVLKAMRQQGHARTAAWLAERLGERSGEFIGVAADHYERAGNSAQALAYFDRAAVDAEKRAAIDAAVAYNERALRQAALTDDQWRFELLMRRFWLADRQARRDAAREALATAAAHAEHCGSDWMRAAVLAYEALDADRRGDATSARAKSERAAALAERTGHAAAAALANGELAWLAMNRSDHAACERYIDAALPWAHRAASLPLREGGGAGFESQLTLIAVSSLNVQNRAVEAAAALDRALALPSASIRVAELHLLERRVSICFQLGDRDGAQRCAERIVALAREADVPRMIPTGLKLLAEVARLRGDHASHLRLAVEATTLARRVNPGFLPQMLLIQADAHEALGDDASALALLAEARDGYAARQKHDRALDCRVRIAAIRLRAGDVRAARDEVESVLVAAAAKSEPLAMETMLTCRKVLHASAADEGRSDPRVDQLLDDVLAQLARVLAEVDDEAVRERIVTNVPHWREAVVERDRRESRPRPSLDLCGATRDHER